MKNRVLMAMTMAMAIQTGCLEAADSNTVTVYLENGLSPVDQFFVRDTASKMFETAGVKMMWRTGEPSPSAVAEENPIVIRFSFQTAAADHPGALAFALPYEGVHITIFYDRIRTNSARQTRAVLAHVLVHEITHILQGVARHSDTGVMKAKYSSRDYMEMTWHPLPFTSTDIELIQKGVSDRVVILANAKASASRDTAAEVRK